MTKSQAVFAFLEGLMPFYREGAVQEGAALPYGTCAYAEGAWDGGEIPLTLTLRFDAAKEQLADQKALALSELVGCGGVSLACDGGYVWLKRGTPWCSSGREQGTDVTLRTIRLTAEFLTLS